MSASAIVPALAVAAMLALVLGAALGWAATRLQPDTDSLAARIDALLPQTQCGQCRYPGCRPYAEAIARGEAETDQCPPGGDHTARALAGLLGREPRPVNPEFGDVATAGVAVVDEARCIGCALCLPACPVDAIIGRAALHAHGNRGAVHGLWSVHSALPGGLHRNEAAGRRHRASRAAGGLRNRCSPDAGFQQGCDCLRTRPSRCGSHCSRRPRPLSRSSRSTRAAEPRQSHSQRGRESTARDPDRACTRPFRTAGARAGRRRRTRRGDS